MACPAARCPRAQAADGHATRADIYKKVNEVVRCLDVNINPGGCSWLHAIVQIDKRSEDDGKKAIQAAFAGHRSCKHVFVVDKDIDIYNPLEVEWAMATRFQGDTDLVIKSKETRVQPRPFQRAHGSGTHLTTKLGFDLTKPLVSHGKDFDKAIFPLVDIDQLHKGMTIILIILFLYLQFPWKREHAAYS